VILAAAPATAYREYVYRPHGHLARWVADRFDVVARPGQRIERPPREGDVLLEVTLGQLTAGRCRALTPADLDVLTSRSRLAHGQLLLRPRKRDEMPGPPVSHRWPWHPIESAPDEALSEEATADQEASVGQHTAYDWAADFDREAAIDEEPAHSPAAFTAVRAAYAAATPAARADLVRRGIDSVKARRAALQSQTAYGGGPIPAVRARIEADTGITLDANPMVGVSDSQVEEVYRTFTEGALTDPWTLLALWVKQGRAASHEFANAGTTERNARALWRSAYYFLTMGLGSFTHLTPAGRDNDFAFDDASAPMHDAAFTTAIAGQVAAGRLARNISADIDAELLVEPDAAARGHFTVTPSARFFTLSLSLSDACYRENKAAAEADTRIGANADPGLIYARWNLGRTRFARFIDSADRHRAERQYEMPDGAHPSIAQWAFERHVAQHEYRQLRAHAIQFRYYVEAYRLIFEGGV
jgi:hypothetical protein